jgi:hypothetical protein
MNKERKKGDRTHENERKTKNEKVRKQRNI